MRNSSLSDHYIRLGMSNEMRQKIEDWRVLNRNPETGKIVSFSKAVRLLIDNGLRKNIKTDYRASQSN